MTREFYAEAYRNGHGKTVNFLISKGFPEQLAEETAQAAWARGWERKGQLRDERKAVPWVNSIALNIGRTHIRRASMFLELPELITQASTDVVASVDVARKLKQCPLKERSLLEKRYLKEWDIGELAKEQRCTRRAIRVRLHRARKLLRRLFEGGARDARAVSMDEPAFAGAD
jgi:RNA polymerase sigma-70 factor (ECF subfamily)